MSNNIDKFLDEMAMRSMVNLKNNVEYYRIIPKLNDVLDEHMPIIRELKNTEPALRYKQSSTSLRDYVYKYLDKKSIEYKQADSIITEYLETYGSFIKMLPAYITNEGAYKNDDIFPKILKEMHKDNEYRKRLLKYKVRHYCGEVLDASNLSIGYDSGINGIIKGTRGRAKIESILAGGYNIQRLHIRVLVNALDGQDKEYQRGYIKNASDFEYRDQKGYMAGVYYFGDIIKSYKPDNDKEIQDRLNDFGVLDEIKSRGRVNQMSVDGVDYYTLMLEGGSSILFMATYGAFLFDTNKNIMEFIFCLDSEYIQHRPTRVLSILTKIKLYEMMRYYEIALESNAPKAVYVEGQKLLLAHTRDVVRINKKRAKEYYDNDFQININNSNKDKLFVSVEAPVKNGLTSTFNTRYANTPEKFGFDGKDFYINGVKQEIDVNKYIDIMSRNVIYDFKKHDIEVVEPKNNGEFMRIRLSVELSTKNPETYRKNLNKIIDKVLIYCEKYVHRVPEDLLEDFRETN